MQPILNLYQDTIDKSMAILLGIPVLAQIDIPDITEVSDVIYKSLP